MVFEEMVRRLSALTALSDRLSDSLERMARRMNIAGAEASALMGGLAGAGEAGAAPRSAPQTPAGDAGARLAAPDMSGVQAALGRFAEALLRAGKLDSYMGKLIGAFNPETVPQMMCRAELSVGPNGCLYDCDFNQALGVPCADKRMIGDLLDPSQPLKRGICFGNHCYSCTAGAGSS